MSRRLRVAACVIAICVSAGALAAVPAIAQLPNAVIGTGRVQGVTVLVNARGHTVYIFTHDSRGRSNCYGQCLSGWKPVLTGGKVFARRGSAVHPKLLGTTRRRDGKLQVTYNHHPLYTNTEDTGPGQDYGQFCQGVPSGYWFIINPRGDPNKHVISICTGY